MVNGKRLLKYLIMLFVVSMSTYYIPNCSIINEHALYVGLLASSTFAILDNCMSEKVIIDGH
jgi:hypothetical protein